MDTLLERLHVVKFGREYLLAALDVCGDAYLDFRPARATAAPPPPAGSQPPPYSLREHFLHIADIGEMFVFEGILGTEMPEARYRIQTGSDGGWTLRQEWPTAASVRAELAASWAFQDEHVFHRPLAALTQHIGKEGKSLLADEIGWLIFHESQHRGQVLTCLRLAGLTPPDW